MADNSFQIFDYDDVLLIPRLCVVDSRSECDPSITFGGHKFKLPVIPANMITVVNEELCRKLATDGYFYIMHRFRVDVVEFAKGMINEGLLCSISVGVKERDYETVRALKAEGAIPHFITIDIAHGHALSVKRMIAFIKENLPSTFVIAGNVATPEAVEALESWGADATKIGVGPGKVCITRNKTGFGTGGWQLAAVKWCASVAKKPVIADGGVRHHGDIAKTIRFGATMVMIGSLFAGLRESPGRTIEVDGKEYKEYYGSASEYNKDDRKNVEGKRILQPLKGTLDEFLRELTQDLQSSLSYAGGKDLSALTKCSYVIIGGINKWDHLFARHSVESYSVIQPQ